MSENETRAPSRTMLYGFVVASWLACQCLGCEGLAGLDAYRLTTRDAEAAVQACTTHLDCRARTSADDSSPNVHCAFGRCVALESQDCRVAVPSEDATRLLVGTLFSTSGSLGAENRARENSAVLAVREINDAGGVTGPANAQVRPIALISCDSAVNPLRAAEHLVKLGVPAIVGPESSQIMLELSNKLTVPSGTLLMSPVASANFSDLADRDLDWLLAPAPELRIPLVRKQLAAIAEELRANRSRPLKVGVIVREDAFGRSALSTLLRVTLEGTAFAESASGDEQGQIDAYTEASGYSPKSLVQTYLDYAPDALLLIGLSEVVTDFIKPLELSWGKTAATQAKARPLYVLTEGARVPALLEVATLHPELDLAPRVYGTMAVPTLEARTVFESFKAAYRAHFPDGTVDVDVNGTGATYDAVYALAFAFASLSSDEITGQSVASALHTRFSGDALVPVGRNGIAEAFNKLSAGESIRALGTMGLLDWDDSGALLGGAAEVFCLREQDSKVHFGTAGVRLDLATQTVRGEFMNCARTNPADEQPSAAREPTPSMQKGQPFTGAHADRASGAAGSKSPAGGAGAASEDAGVAPSMSVPSAGTGAVGNSAPPEQPGVGLVRCGDQECATQANTQCCCVSSLTADMFHPEHGDFSCVAAAQADLSCVAVLYCDRDAACKAGDVCCGVGASAQCTSAEACRARGSLRLHCSRGSDCADGASCCASRCVGSLGYCDFSCRDACGADETAVCASDANCTPATTGKTCRPSPNWLGVHVCQDPRRP